MTTSRKLRDPAPGDGPKINLLTMSPSTGLWQYAGSTNWSRNAKQAVRRFQKLHPEQTVAACYARPGARLVRP